MIVVMELIQSLEPEASYFYPGADRAMGASRETPWVELRTPTGRIETLEDLLCLLHELGHHNNVVVEGRYTEYELAYLVYDAGSRKRAVEEIEAWRYAFRCIKEDVYNKAWLVIYDRLKAYDVFAYFRATTVERYIKGKTDTLEGR